jgi:hypothetical protein
VPKTVNPRTQITVVQHSQIEAGSSILQEKKMDNDLPRLTFGYHERWA